jgi:ubiquinol-cytochrome c reductase cytochrome b subunit
VPNPFWGGALFPLVVIGILYLWPWLERKVTGDEAFHNLLERPRENPGRTATVTALLVWVFLVFWAGSSDRFYVLFGLSYSHQIWAYRALLVVAPVVTFFATRRVCRELLAGEIVRSVQHAAEEEGVTSA